jgi:hypothetical protein
VGQKKLEFLYLKLENLCFTSRGAQPKLQFSYRIENGTRVGVLPKSDCKTFQKSSDVDDKAAPRRVMVRLHAPTKAWFMASVIIALVAVFSALSPVPYVTSYGVWVAILAYVVLALGNLASS